MHQGNSFIMRLALREQQEEFFIFEEQPSDKYDGNSQDLISKIGARLEASELFAAFTANIIKEKVVFSR